MGRFCSKILCCGKPKIKEEPVICEREQPPNVTRNNERPVDTEKREPKEYVSSAEIPVVPENVTDGEKEEMKPEVKAECKQEIVIEQSMESTEVITGTDKEITKEEIVKEYIKETVIEEESAKESEMESKETVIDRQQAQEDDKLVVQTETTEVADDIGRDKIHLEKEGLQHVHNEDSSPVHRPMFTATECSRSMLTAPEDSEESNKITKQTAALANEMDNELKDLKPLNKSSATEVSDKVISELKEALKRNGMDIDSKASSENPLQRTEITANKLDSAELIAANMQKTASSSQSETAIEKSEGIHSISSLEKTALTVPFNNSTTSLATTVSTTTIKSTTSAQSNDSKVETGQEPKTRSRKRRDRRRRKTLTNEPDIASIKKAASSN